MQKEKHILELIFVLTCKQSRKLKFYKEKVSALILKGKMRLQQFAEIDPAEIVVPFTNSESGSFWTQDEHWQKASNNFLGEINNRYPESK